MSDGLKLNLGCGQNHLPGYVNVDKYGEPDVRCDLEEFPWIWADNSVNEVVLHHVLEHLGETTAVYLGILKELYRICQPDAIVHITVPHPRHDDFLNDPTHVRAVTPDSLALFSKKNNREWAELKAANSPLGFYLNVDFELVHTDYLLDEPWLSQYKAGDIDHDDIWLAGRQFNNVFKQIEMTLKVVKKDADSAAIAPSSENSP
jgi:ubiquinone/menaquinone biosynthesis C-methylase UbiE